MKELNVKIVDLETKSYATPSRVSLGNVAKTHRTGGDGTPVRQRARQEDELVNSLRSTLSDLVRECQNYFLQLFIDDMNSKPQRMRYSWLNARQSWKREKLKRKL